VVSLTIPGKSIVDDEPDIASAFDDFRDNGI
jgi:hypothetical protein